MIWLRKNEARGLIASLLIAVFFGAQTLSCCLVTNHLGRFLASAWSKHQAMAADHSCCAKRATGENPAPKSKDCCLHDSGSKVPQLASEQAPLEPEPAIVVALLPSPSASAPASAAAAPLRIDSGPPVYLQNLRLLI